VAASSGERPLAGEPPIDMTAPADLPTHPRSLRRPLLLVLAGLLLAGALHGPRWAGALREYRLRRMSLDQLAEISRRHPDDLAAHYQLALAQERAGDYPAATRELLAVLDRDPSRAEVLNDLGVVYLLQQRYYESLVALQGAMAARPDYGRASANLGRLHLATKMPYTAVREFERAVQLGAADAPTLCDLGIAYQQTLNFQSARRTYERVLGREPHSATAWLGLARTCEGLTDYDHAADAARRALRERPRDPAAMAALGRIQLLRAATRADLESARRLLADAATGDPDDPEARYDFGRALRRLGDEAGAIAALRQTLRLAPDHAGAAYQLSQALIASGHATEGERFGAAFRGMAERAREQDRLEEQVYQKPGDLAARLRLALLYAATHRPGLALLQCRQILNADPANAAARQLVEAVSIQARRGQ
jgi:tetratricopeptide (TPR) repeat protein